MWMEGRKLIVPMPTRLFALPRRVAVDLTLYEDTFRCNLDPFKRSAPSIVWTFRAPDHTWSLRLYKQMANAARVAAPQAAAIGYDTLELTPSIRTPRTSTHYLFDEVVLKQLEFIRAIGQDDLTKRSAVTSSAAKLGLEALRQILHTAQVEYGQLLSEYGRWRYSPSLCNACNQQHAPCNPCGVFNGGRHATGDDSLG